MNELTMVDSYCQLSRTALSFKREVTREEWQKVFDALNHIEGCVQFWIGDALKYREQKWGMYDDIAEETGIEKRTLRQYKQIAEQVESGTRVPELSFTHHREVASLKPEKQKEFLQRAVDEELSVRELRSEIRKTEIKEEIILPSGKYKIIYADPPWQYENSGFENSAESNYPTMPLEKICDLPIQDLCTDESVLFLWATNPLLKEAFDVMEAWGFTYKTNFAWIKDKARGWAWWAKSKHELILVGVRPKSGTPAKNYDSAFMEKRENKHSKKPEFVYEMIEDMFPDSKYIELFARNTRKGWDGWGNQL